MSGTVNFIIPKDSLAIVLYSLGIKSCINMVAHVIIKIKDQCLKFDSDKFKNLGKSLFSELILRTHRPLYNRNTNVNYNEHMPKAYFLLNVNAT